MTNKDNRRDFLKKFAQGAVVAGATGLAFTEAQANRSFMLKKDTSVPKKISPNDKIRVALIGTGGRGLGITKDAIKVPGIELVAGADVYDGRLTRTKELFGKDVFTTRDYREILNRSDIDAVIIASPDHWHHQMCLDAIAAKKAVYCEKPMVQTIDQGHDVLGALKKNKVVFQVGSQRVSSIVYEKARDLYKAGEIGQLNIVEAWWDRQSALGAWQYSIPTDASKQTIDWDRFLGNAPKVSFDPVRLFRWRNYRDYGTGVAGDLFVHLFTGLHFILNGIGPNRVMATGGLRYWNDGRDVPDVMYGLYDFPKTAAHPAFNLMLRVNFVDGSGGSSGFRFVGSEGMMTVSDSKITIKKKKMPDAPGYSINSFAQSQQDEFMKQYEAQYPPKKPEIISPTEAEYLAPQGFNDTYYHFVNFFDAMRNNKPVTEDAAFGLRACGPALLTNRSYFEGKAFGWDPEKMKIS